MRTKIKDRWQNVVQMFLNQSPRPIKVLVAGRMSFLSFFSIAECCTLR